jgi:hypothetical protein
MPMKRLRIFNPILYQGASRKKNYFEGWYFKHTASGPLAGKADRGPRTLVFIPGISRSSEGDHAFVQTIDGAGNSSRYFSFPVSAFSASDDPFEVRVGSNRFSLAGINAALEDKDGRIEATILYGKAAPPRSSLFSPGVMGPYAFAPFLECYHGIASFNHTTEGYATITDAASDTSDRIIFDDGRGYIEKDWGRSMPQAWVWMQANDFDRAAGPASFTLSLARVPWRGRAFNGFICILWIAGEEYRFATYTGARIDLLEHEGTTLRVLLSDRSYKMEVQVRSAHTGELAAPSNGAMSRSIAESVDAWMRILLKRRHGATDELVFDSSSPAAGAEIVGDLETLKP